MSHCDGNGWSGGAKTYRVCSGCERELANTAFKVGAPVCMKCQGGYTYTRKPGCPKNLQHDAVHLSSSRMKFAEWLRHIGASRADRGAIQRAVKRYGMKRPCPDEVLQEYVRGEPAHTRERKFRDLWHATVLLAAEQRNQGRLGTYKIGSRGQGRGAPPAEQRKSRAA